jgi:glycosyltransferase involved in cell wall biosynthesis
MPAHNEHGYLESAVNTVVGAMRLRPAGFEVIIAENGSFDGTLDEAKALAVDAPEVSVISSPVADYGAALRAGYLASTGDIVVNMDVDLVDMDFLDRAIRLLESGDLAIVVGSKRTRGAEDRRSLPRRVITMAFSLVLKLGFGLRISDTHGLKALRRAPLVRLVEECRFGKDIFDTELIIRAERARLAVTEIPVVVEETRPPRTSIIRRIPRTLVGLARLRLELGLRSRETTPEG